MKERHLSREILDLFALGDLPEAEAEEVERHLEACSDCRDRADESSDLLSLPLLDWLGSDYDTAFDRAVLGAAEQLSGLRREARDAEGLLAELLREPAPERRRRVQDDPRFHSLKLCQLLRARGYEHRFSDPGIVLESAELAAGLAQYLDSHRYGSSLVEDARALSWCSLSNAFRIVSDFWRAERALRQAWSHYEQSCGDAHTNAELLTFTASLRISQGRFSEACRLLDDSIEIYRDGQESRLEGSMLIQKGLALNYDGRNEEALSAIRSGISRVGDESPLLFLIGQHNLSRILIEIGAVEKARRIIEETRPLYRETGDPVILVRFRWLEASLAEALGRRAEAEAALLDVRQFFLEQQNGPDVFLVSLNLAWIYTQDRQWRRVREILGAAISLGELAGYPQEVLAARILYEQALKG